MEADPAAPCPKRSFMPMETQQAARPPVRSRVADSVIALLAGCLAVGVLTGAVVAVLEPPRRWGDTMAINLFIWLFAAITGAAIWSTYVWRVRRRAGRRPG